MFINLTKEQFEILIKAVDTGSSVYGILGDNISEDYKKQSNEIEKLEDYLLSFSSDFGMPEITEEFMGKLIIADDYSEQLQEVMDEYDNESFWHELEVHLGKRDFERTLTESERKQMVENHGWYPERIHELYEKWNKEFQEYGIERLEVQEDQRLQ